MHDANPNKLVKVQNTDPLTYRGNFNKEQITDINRARAARKQVAQDALLSIPENDRIPIAKLEIHDGYFYQDYVKNGMELTEFQSKFPDDWKRIQAEFQRRRKIAVEAVQDNLRRFYRETPNRSSYSWRYVSRNSPTRLATSELHRATSSTAEPDV